jgi:hypothetical protein
MPMTMARISDLHSKLMKRPPVGPRLTAHAVGSIGQELPDRRGDRPGMRLQREVPGLEETDVCFRDVALECLRARRQEEGVVLAPDSQQAGPVLPK